MEADGGRFQRQEPIRHDTRVGPTRIGHTVQKKHMIGKNLAKPEFVIGRFGFGLLNMRDGDVHDCWYSLIGGRSVTEIVAGLKESAGCAH